MDISEGVPRSSTDQNPLERIDDKKFFVVIKESLGKQVCQLIESSRPSGPAAPASMSLMDVPEGVRRKLRLIVASDAMRGCLERHYDLEFTCTADDRFELWPHGRVSRPPTPTEDLYHLARLELPGAMAIVNLVNGRLGPDGYYAHLPKGLAAIEIEQLLRLMSVRVWRKALEMRYSFYFGFRAPYHLAAAKAIDNPYLRNFVSLEEQVRAGLSLSDP
ncbi:hypothetical protein M0Q28_01870 [Patescibacteria group bacterium]|jgi:hypothetical protein|nr:hypothetical protein [Patescibacteria group bacterium]